MMYNISIKEKRGSFMEYERIADTEGYFKIFKYDKKSCPPAHMDTYKLHNSIEIIFVTNGRFQVKVRDDEYVLNSGEGVYIDKLVPHHTAQKIDVGELDCYVFIFAPKYVSAVSGLDNNTFETFLEKTEGFCEIIQLLEWAFSHRKSFNEEIKSGVATTLLGLLKNYYKMHPKQYTKQAKLLLEIVVYIDNNYFRNITLEGLSQHFGYEKTYLSKLLNKFLGMNLREYLNRRRIVGVNKIKKRNPDMPLLKISEECGFESPNTFYRAYSKYKDETNI